MVDVTEQEILIAELNQILEENIMSETANCRKLSNSSNIEKWLRPINI